MMVRHLLLPAVAVLTCLGADRAYAAPCAGGGTLTINAAADSLTLAPTPATTFNFGEHVILTATATGFSIATYAWTVGGPTIKDYNEDLGTKAVPTPAAPRPWSTTPLAAADLTKPSVAFYWSPAASQAEPNNGPFSRAVTLAVTKVGGGTCSVTANFAVERNMTNTNRQAEDFYTSNHRAPTTTNPLFGRVVDEHIYWHQSVHDLSSYPVWTRFLIWHSEFLRRYDTWRQTFGYKKVDPWYPGRPLPTGPKFNVDPTLRIPFVPANNRIPTYYTLIGGTTADGGRRKLADYATLDALTASLEGTFHGQVHCNIGAHIGSSFGTSGPGYGSMCNTSSPKDPIFWRWHGFIDVMYRNYCKLHPTSCTIPPPADPPVWAWVADNPADIANNGAPPSPAPHSTSPDVWNRRAEVTTDACVGPLDANGNRVTTGGVARNCGNSADHENPVAGVTNYLYGRLRNTRPGTGRVAYAEVGVYYTQGTTGLVYPANFTLVPESRQFIALHVEPGVTTAIGPIPWTPPPVLPAAASRYSLYLRVITTQNDPPVETASGLNTDVANNNDLAWRTIKVVAPGDTSPPTF
jgi:hypothetical protein